MSIGTISSGNTPTAASLDNSKTAIAGNFNTFLQLLTTQLKNQNPLNPLDTNQFTQQLVQFTSVEQQLKTNEFLSSLMQASQTASTSQAVSFIGKEVSATNTMTNLKNGAASWLYKLDQPAAKAIISVKDSTGNTVFSKETSLQAGDGRFDWDGKNDAGQMQKDGAYQIQIDATDTNGNPVTATTQTTGIVDGVDFSGSEPYLVIGNSRISLANVMSVQSQPATTG